MRKYLFLTLLLLPCTTWGQQFEQVCPAGSYSITPLNSFDNSNGSYRQNWCVDYFGNINLQSVTIISNPGSPGSNPSSSTSPFGLVPANTVFAGPSLNSIGGVIDGSVGNSGGNLQGSPSLINAGPLTPTSTHDWAFFVTGALNSTPGTDPPWTNVASDGGGRLMVWTRELFSASPVTGNLVPNVSTQWAANLFLLKLNGTPTIVQSVFGPGGSGLGDNAGAGSTATFSSTTTAGNSIIAVVCGIPATNAQPAYFQDSAGDVFTPITQAQSANIGNGPHMCASFMASGITGGVSSDVITFHSDAVTGLSTANFWVAEVNNLAPSTINTGVPTFQFLNPNQVPRTVALFNHKNLASDVGVTANTITTIDTISVTMPAVGGPWRVLLSYDYFFSGGVNGECTVSDNQSSGAFAQVDWQPLNNVGTCSTAAWNRVTYGNNTTVIFTITIWDTGATTVKAASTFHTAANSYVQVAVESAN